uniref:SFRICE_017745 n=1 Tax=Spodoptera frugiperda TaxID=7108 RepID=A0A2H1WJQ8_SPOFR
MSVCQSGQPEEDSASEEVAANATRDSYKQKPASKLVRVLTVLAYLLSVSLAAILLSVYYVVVWRAPEAVAEVGEVSARRTGPNTTLHHHRHHYQSVHHAVPTPYTAGTCKLAARRRSGARPPRSAHAEPPPPGRPPRAATLDALSQYNVPPFSRHQEVSSGRHGRRDPHGNSAAAHQENWAISISVSQLPGFVRRRALRQWVVATPAMSGKSCTSGSVRSCGGSVRLGTAGGHEVVLDALYERKRDKKSVRVLTVIVYVFCVSLAAIMLSLYYVFFWEPKDAQYAQRKVFHTVEKQTSTTPMPTCFMPLTGGGNTTVNGEIIPSTPENITGGYPEDNITDSSAGPTVDTTSVPDTTPSDLHNGTSEMNTLNVTDSIT